MERVNRQPTFTDWAVADLGSPRARAFFDRCRDTIPFEQLAASIADVFADDARDADDAGPPAGGRPHWSVVTMLKVVFVQKCFGLSDPMAEEMLLDRISFRQFVGLSLDDQTPDHSTISRFRDRLRRRGHGSTLFDAALAHLRERGLVLNAGTLIDATIIEAPRGQRRRAEDGTGTGSGSGSGSGGSTADPCASHCVKGNRPYFGYRAHTAADRRGILTDFVYDTACVSEHEHFDHLARHERRVVFADSGCRSAERLERLRARGVTPALCHRRVRGQKELSAQQRRLNRLIAPIRAFVEHPYGWIKGRLNQRGRCRYRGLARNALDFALSAVAYNFCRAMSLIATATAAPAAR
jgi:transposase, IS5 family